MVLYGLLSAKLNSAQAFTLGDVVVALAECVGGRCGDISSSNKAQFCRNEHCCSFCQRQRGVHCDNQPWVARTSQWLRPASRQHQWF